MRRALDRHYRLSPVQRALRRSPREVPVRAVREGAALHPLVTNKSRNALGRDRCFSRASHSSQRVAELRPTRVGRRFMPPASLVNRGAASRDARPAKTEGLALGLDEPRRCPSAASPMTATRLTEAPRATLPQFDYRCTTSAARYRSPDSTSAASARCHRRSSHRSRNSRGRLGWSRTRSLHPPQTRPARCRQPSLPWSPATR